MKRFTIPLLAFFITLSTVGSFAFAQGGEAQLELKPSITQAKAGDEFTLDVLLKNPSNQNVISVRSWLTYDANALEGMNISFEGSPFTLAAPGEDTFAPGESHVKIGRSNITGGMKDAEAKVATIRFRVKAQSPVTTVISPYDYQVSELGHVSVNIIDQGFPVNILTAAPEDVKIALNPGAATTQPPVTTQPEPTVQPPDEGVGGTPFTLTRPANLRVNTGSGYAELKWDMAKEEGRAGYYLYYGKASGQYTRQRNVGDVGRYKLDGLNNNETYYFAVSAYDTLNRETDYSDEVGVIISQPLSSTSPFEEMLEGLLALIPQQPQNGPLTWWILFSAFGLSGVVLFRTKKQV